MDKTFNNKAWFLVLPVLLLVAFTAVMPLMTVVNYSVQDTFGNNQFFWTASAGSRNCSIRRTDLGGRFLASLGRNLIFSAIILAIEVPLGILVALSHADEGLGRRGLPGAHGAAAADSVERGRHHLADLRPQRHRPARLRRSTASASTTTTSPTIFDAWFTIIVMDVWHWTSLVVLLCYAGLISIPDAYYQAARIDGASRWAVFRYIQLPKMRRVLLIARAAALHGQLHDLHRALRRHRRRSRQLDHVPLDRAGQDGARPVRPRPGGGDVDRLLPDHPGRVLGVLHRHDQRRRRSQRTRERA